MPIPTARVNRGAGWGYVFTDWRGQKMAQLRRKFCVFASEPWAGEGRFLGTFAFAKFFEFFMKRLLTLKLSPNYIPATGDDVASRAAVW